MTGKKTFCAALAAGILASVASADGGPGYTLEDFDTKLFWKRPEQGKQSF